MDSARYIAIALVLFWPILESNGAPFLGYVYKPRMVYPMDHAAQEVDFEQSNEMDHGKSPKELEIKQEILAMYEKFKLFMFMKTKGILSNVLPVLPYNLRLDRL